LFAPKRRKVQKFCSNSCRVLFHCFKNVGLFLKSTEVQIKEEKQEPKKAKVEQVSAASVANSAICTSLVEHAKNILIPEKK
jgi:hypothetical protein